MENKQAQSLSKFESKVRDSTLDLFTVFQLHWFFIIQRAQVRKKQVDIKNKMIEKSGYSEVFTGDEYGCDSSYEQIKNSLEQKMRS